MSYTRALRAILNPLHFLEDKTLSWAAKGFLAYLKSSDVRNDIIGVEIINLSDLDLKPIIEELQIRGYLTLEEGENLWTITKPHWLRDTEKMIRSEK